MSGNVCLTFNLDSELFWLRIDPAAVDRPKTLSIARYGLLRGVPRVLDLLRRFDVPSTWFVPGLIAERHPEVVERIAAAGHEIASRAWDERPLAGLPAEEQSERIGRGIAALGAILGHAPEGFRAPAGEVDNTTYRAMADAGVRWSSTLRSDDAPIVIDEGAGPIVEIGHRWELTDYIYFQLNFAPAFPAGQGRISSYASVLEEWRDDALATTSLGLPCTFTLTPETIGKPGRAIILERLLGSLRESSVGFSTLGRVAADAGAVAR